MALDARFPAGMTALLKSDKVELSPETQKTPAAAFANGWGFDWRRGTSRAGRT